MTPIDSAAKSATGRSAVGHRQRTIDHGLILILLLPSLIQILTDRPLWDWDVSLYGHQSVTLFNSLVRSPSSWLSQLLQIGDDRPVAIAWLGQFFVPLGRAMGSVRQGLLLLTLCSQWLSAFLLLISLEELLGDKRAARLACAFAMVGPLFVGLGFRYFVEPLQALAIVWVLALVAFHRQLGRSLLSWHAVAAIMLGLAVKPTTPFFQAPLLLYLAILWLRIPSRPAEPTSHRRHLASVMSLALLLTIATCGWYGLHLRQAIQHIAEASSGGESEQYGSRAPWLTKIVPWLNALTAGFFSRWTVVCLVGLALWRPLRVTGNNRVARNQVVVAISAAWIAVTLALFALNVNEDSRYLLAVFPYVAIVVCWALLDIGRPMAIAVAILCALQFTAVWLQVFGYIGPSSEYSPYLKPWDRSDKEWATAEAVVDRTCEQDGVTAVGVQLPEFNEATLNFLAAIRHPDLNCRYFGLPVHETQLGAAAVWNRLNAQPFRYFVYFQFADAKGYEWLNNDSKIILANIDSSPGMKLRLDKSDNVVKIFERHTIVSTADQVERGFPRSGRLPFGYLERPEPGSVVPAELVVGGWVIAEHGVRQIDGCFKPLDRDGSVLCRPSSLTRVGTERADVAQIYRDIDGSAASGFQGLIDLAGIPRGKYQLTLIAHDAKSASRAFATLPIHVIPFVD